MDSGGDPEEERGPGEPGRPGVGPFRAGNPVESPQDPAESTARGLPESTTHPGGLKTVPARNSWLVSVRLFGHFGGGIAPGDWSFPK